MGGTGYRIFRDRQRKALGGGKFATGGAGGGLPIRQHFDLLADRITHRTAGGGDLKIVVAKTGNPDRDVDRADLVGGHLHGQGGGHALAGID